MNGRLGVDVGGTFTDLVVLRGGELRTAKVPSTPSDQSEGVLAAVDAAAVEGSALAAFAHGMTVATNALLERRGARVALVTTEGFRDVLEIARQNRPALYDLTAARPPALVPRELRFCVRERMGPEGEIEPLDEDSLAEAVAAVRDADVEAVAVGLLFAFLHPEHERTVGDQAVVVGHRSADRPADAPAVTLEGEEGARPGAVSDHGDEGVPAHSGDGCRELGA